MRMKIDDMPAEARERVAAALGIESKGTCKESLKVDAPLTKEAIRELQEEAHALWYPKGEMNKTERRFFDTFLRDDWAAGKTLVLAQHVRVPLPGGGTYCPDFVVVEDGAVRLYEIKGGYKGAGWDQGWERYKRAAAYLEKFGVMCFLAEWTKRKNWAFTGWRYNDRA